MGHAGSRLVIRMNTILDLQPFINIASPFQKIFVRIHYLLFSITFLFFASTCMGQYFQINVKLIDKGTGLPIEFASACYKKNKSICSISDSTGALAVKVINDDTLLLTRIGYYPFLLPGTMLLKMDTLSLVATELKLPEVVVSTNSFDEEEIVGKNKKKNFTISVEPNMEFAKLFSVDSKSNLLTELSFYTREIKNSSLSFHITVYGYNEKANLPQEVIGSKLVRVIIGSKEINKITINMEDPIIVPSKFFVAVKYLGVDPGGQNVSLLATTKEKKPLTYERYFSSQWIGYPNYFVLNITQKEIPNIVLLVTLKH